MPVSMDWDNPEKTIIRVTFEGVWDVSDIQRMITKGVSMLESVDHKVDSIFDFTHSHFSPRNLISTLDRMESTHHRNERLVVIVNANVYIRSMAKVGQALAPKTFAHMHFANGLNQAYAIVQQQINPVFATAPAYQA